MQIDFHVFFVHVYTLLSSFLLILAYGSFHDVDLHILQKKKKKKHTHTHSTPLHCVGTFPIIIVWCFIGGS